ncbi:hypothetical protein NFJ02_36g92270 [Pycnococcus provasolii]
MAEARACARARARARAAAPRVASPFTRCLSLLLLLLLTALGSLVLVAGQASTDDASSVLIPMPSGEYQASGGVESAVSSSEGVPLSLTGQQPARVPAETSALLESAQSAARDVLDEEAAEEGVLPTDRPWRGGGGGGGGGGGDAVQDVPDGRDALQGNGAQLPEGVATSDAAPDENVVAQVQQQEEPASRLTAPFVNDERRSNEAEPFAQSSPELRVLYTLPRNPGTVTGRASSVRHEAAVALEGLEAFTVVFSLPVLGVDYRQHSLDEKLPIEKVPFRLQPPVNGHIRWLNSYTASWVPSEPWPCDMEVEVEWNYNMTSALGARIRGTHAFPRAVIVTPLLTVRLVRIVSPTARDATAGRWQPFWREDSRIRAMGRSAPESLTKVLEQPISERLNLMQFENRTYDGGLATKFSSNVSYAEMPPDAGAYFVFQEGTCFVNFELLADAFEVRASIPRLYGGSRVVMEETELPAEDAKKISFKVQPCERDWDWAVPESEGVRRHRPTRADELEAHLSEGYRNEYGSCAKVSVRGFDAEKHYVVKLERGRSLHELGTKSKVAWTSGMKGIEPFRINLHGSRLLLEKFHAAFDEDGVWHLDHRRENRREVKPLRPGRHGDSFFDEYSQAINQSAVNIVEQLPFFGRRNLDVFLPYGLNADVTNEMLEKLIAVHTLPVPAWLFECGSNRWACLPEAKGVNLKNLPENAPESMQRWKEILRVHERGYQDRKMIANIHVSRLGTDVVRITLPELTPDQYYEISIAGSEDVRDLFDQPLRTSRSAFFTSYGQSFQQASWPPMTMDPATLEDGVLRGIPVISRGPSAYADGHRGDGPPGFDDKDDDSRRLPLRTAIWDVRNIDEMLSAIGLLAGNEKDTGLLRTHVIDRGDEDQFAGRFAGLQSTVYARNDPNDTLPVLQTLSPKNKNVTSGAFMLRTCCVYVEEEFDENFVYFSSAFLKAERSGATMIGGRRSLMAKKTKPKNAYYLYKNLVEGIMRRIDVSVLTVTSVMSFVTVGPDRAYALVLRSGDMEWTPVSDAEVVIGSMARVMKKGKVVPLAKLKTGADGFAEDEVDSIESFGKDDLRAIGIAVAPTHSAHYKMHQAAPFMNFVFGDHIRALPSGKEVQMHAVLHSDREIYRSGEIVNVFGYVFKGESVLRHITVSEHWAPGGDRSAMTTALEAATSTTDFYLEMTWDHAKGTRVQVPVFINPATGHFSAHVHVPVTFQHDRVRINLYYAVGFSYDVQSHVKLSKFTDQYLQSVQRGEAPLSFLHEETLDSAAAGVASADEVTEGASKTSMTSLDTAYGEYIQSVQQAMRLMEERERIVAAKDGAVKRRTGKLLASQVVSVLPRSLGAPNPYLDVSLGTPNDHVAFFADEPVKIKFRAGGLHLRHLEMSEVFADVKVLRSTKSLNDNPVDPEYALLTGAKGLHRVVHHETRVISLDEFAASHDLLVDVMNKASDGDLLHIEAVLKPTTQQRIERNHTAILRPRRHRLDVMLSTTKPLPGVPFGVAVQSFDTELQRVEPNSFDVTVEFGPNGGKITTCTIASTNPMATSGRPSFTKCRFLMTRAVAHRLSLCAHLPHGQKVCEDRTVGRDFATAPIDLGDIVSAKRTCQMGHPSVSLGSEATVVIDYLHRGGKALVVWGDHMASKSQVVDLDDFRVDGGMAEIKFGPITREECAEGCDVHVTVAVPRQDDGKLSPFVRAVMDKKFPRSKAFDARSALAYNCSTEAFAFQKDTRRGGATGQIIDLRVTASSTSITGGGKVLVRVDLNNQVNKTSGSANGTLVLTVTDSMFTSSEELRRRGTPEDINPGVRLHDVELFQSFASTSHSASPGAMKEVVEALDRRTRSSSLEGASTRDFMLMRPGNANDNETLAVDMDDTRYISEGMADCLTSSPYGCTAFGIDRRPAAHEAWELEIYQNAHVEGNRVPYQQIRALMREESETGVARAGTMYTVKRAIDPKEASHDVEFNVPPNFSGNLVVRAFVSLPGPSYGYGSTDINATTAGDSRLTVDLPHHVRSGDVFQTVGALHCKYHDAGKTEVYIETSGGLEVQGRGRQQLSSRGGAYHFNIKVLGGFEGPAAITFKAKSAKYGDLIVSGPHAVHVYHRTLRSLVLDAVTVPVSSGGTPGIELKKFPAFGRDGEGGIYASAGVGTMPALPVLISHALQRPQLVTAEWLLCSVQASALARARQLEGNMQLHGVISDIEELDRIMHSTARTLLRFTTKEIGLRSMLLPDVNGDRIDIQLNAWGIVMMDALEEVKGVELPSAVVLARNDWAEALQFEVTKRIVGCTVGGYMHASVDYAGTWFTAQASNGTSPSYRNCRQVLADDLAAVRLAMGYDWNPPNMGETMRKTIAVIDDEGDRSHLGELTTRSLGAMLASFMRYAKKRKMFTNARLVETLLSILSSRLADGDSPRAFFRDLDGTRSAGHVSNAFALLGILELADWRSEAFGSNAVEIARGMLPQLRRVAAHISSTPAHDHADMSTLGWLEIGVTTVALMRFEMLMQESPSGSKFEARLSGNIVGKVEIEGGKQRTWMRFTPWRDVGMDTAEVRSKGVDSVLLYAHGEGNLHASVGISFSPRPVTTTLSRGGVAIQRIVQPIREGRVDVTAAATTKFKQGDVVLVTLQVTSHAYLASGIEVLEPVSGALASIVPEMSEVCDPESVYVPSALKMDLSPECPMAGYESGYLRVLWQSFRSGTKEFRYRAVVKHTGVFHHGSAVARARDGAGAYATSGESRMEMVGANEEIEKPPIPPRALQDNVLRCPHEVFGARNVVASLSTSESHDFIDCTGVGSCDVRSGKCMCDDGKSGEMCETSVEITESSEEAVGDDDGFVEAFETRRREGTNVAFVFEAIAFLALAGGLPAAVYAYRRAYGYLKTK